MFHGLGHEADLLPLTNGERLKMGLPFKPPTPVEVVTPEEREMRTDEEDDDDDEEGSVVETVTELELDEILTGARTAEICFTSLLVPLVALM